MYGLAFALRLLMVVYGEWQDRRLALQYTDVDYEVISDAAVLVTQGRSPYERATYRYSPLLAYLLVPNSILHRCWGKVIFSIADLGVGGLLQFILSLQGLPRGTSLQFACLWLLNPLSINVSTRGSFDSVTSVLVLSTVATLLKGSLVWSALAFGLVVHLRVYPIIYAPAFALHVAWKSFEQVRGVSSTGRGYRVFAKLLSRRPLYFALLSSATFFGCTLLCVHLHREEFVHEALLYHLTRTDNRHNYSLYWYWIYLDYEAPHRLLLGLVAFIPQAILLVCCACLLHKDLPLCVMVQTALFVFFNKVFTGQYLTWYLSLAPLIAPRLAIGSVEGSILIGGWLCSLFSWLYVAWNLEMKGRNLFLVLWAASVLMFAANVYTLNACLRGVIGR